MFEERLKFLRQFFTSNLCFSKTYNIFWSGEENALKGSANMFSWKDVSKYKCQCILF